MHITEDQVRDEARELLNLHPTDIAQCGVGQNTSFNKLGFTGVPDKPDGWYFPNNTSDVAIILETKNSDIDINRQDCKEELFKNIDIASTKYDKVIGILYNGEKVLVYKDKQLADLKDQLFTKEYYLKLYTKDTIDKHAIFSLTERINNNLHKKFGVNNLYHRMIFTSCALVAQRYKKNCLKKGSSYKEMHAAILTTIENAYEEDKKYNLKLELISQQFSLIQCNFTENQSAIDEFIECIDGISANINSDYWNGEDVMAIFFNEFTRYKGKSEQGQVFTPDHITSLIYRITQTSHRDNVLDACCGSGAFLVKAMSYMISEVGGINNEDAVTKIKKKQLFGVEFSKELYALACANMLIHKDGKTNLTQGDSRDATIGKWIKSKKITKVLMNPPYENAYGCLEIVKNVLDNVEEDAICAFIMPDNKLATFMGEWIRKIMKHHTIQKIIKLPDVFSGMASVDTSIFIFKAHEPQNDKQIFACWIEDDGLESVKNKGRLDVKGKWQDIENKWVEIIYKQSGDNSIQWIKPTDIIMYKTPENIYSYDEKAFRASVAEFSIYKNKDTSIIYKKDGNEILSNSYKILQFLEGYSNCVMYPQNDLDSQPWDSFNLMELFDLDKTGGTEPSQGSIEGGTNLVIAGKYNNGVSSKKIRSIKKPFESNRLTLVKQGDGAAGLAFYQDEDFYTTASVYVLKSKNEKFDKYHGLFLVTVIKRFKAEFNHGNGINEDKLLKLKINLPSTVDEDNNTVPDWDYMRNHTLNLFNAIDNSNIFNQSNQANTTSQTEEQFAKKKFKP